MKVEKIVRLAAENLKTEPENLISVIKKFQKEIEESEGEIRRLKTIY